MRAATTVTTLAVLATATASVVNVTLTTESSNKDINGLSLNDTHFGAGVNGILLSDKLTYYDLDTDSKEISKNYPGYKYRLGQQFDELVNGYSIDPPFALAENNYLTYNGSDSVFYACSKLKWDPYEYLERFPGTYGVGIYAENAPSECQSIKIKISPVGDGKSAPAVNNGTESSAPVTANGAVSFGVSYACIASVVAGATFYLF